MNNQKILEKAIEKAIENGWQSNYFEIGGEIIYITFIYSRPFAKALWGEDIIKSPGLDWFMDVPAYKWHLAHMAIADDPVKYLGDNI